jgi:hypothetical protein
MDFILLAGFSSSGPIDFGLLAGFSWKKQKSNGQFMHLKVSGLG